MWYLDVQTDKISPAFIRTKQLLFLTEDKLLLQSLAGLLLFSLVMMVAQNLSSLAQVLMGRSRGAR